MALSAEQQRALRRRHKHERQAVVFGSLIAGLALAALGATAVYTGTMNVPFLERDFSTPTPKAETGLPPAPCPPEGTLPVTYDTIQITVFNGSGRTGLAGETANALGARGFVVLGTGNYPTNIPTSAEIDFGESGLAAAYTLAAHLDAPVLVLDTRSEPTVDLIVGESFAGVLDPATVVLDPAVPLTGVLGCVPLDQAREQATPGPTPAAPPTGEAPAEGEPPAEG